jgi:hypothetical protein
VYHFVLENDGQRLAAANFGYLQNAAVAPGEAIKWEFRFPRKTVLVQDARLPGLLAQVKCRYE